MVIKLKPFQASMSDVQILAKLILLPYKSQTKMTASKIPLLSKGRFATRFDYSSLICQLDQRRVNIYSNSLDFLVSLMLCLLEEKICKRCQFMIDDRRPSIETPSLPFMHTSVFASKRFAKLCTLCNTLCFQP